MLTNLSGGKVVEGSLNLRVRSWRFNGVLHCPYCILSTQMVLNPPCLVLSEVETVLAPDLLVVEWSTTGHAITTH